MSFRNEDPKFSPSSRVLPRFERSVLSGLLSTSSFVLSEQNLLRVFRWETKKLTHLLEDDESFDIFQVIRIPRVIGVSEFNRQWSVLMAVDHLCLVLEDCRKAIVALSDGVEPKGELDLSLYVPRPDLGFDVLDRFENLTSRFISEIPRELIEEVRMQTTLSRPTSFAAHGAVPGTDIELGQRVLHKMFGEGVVLNFEGRGSHARVQVNFDDEGSKWLVLEYANLQTL